LMSYDSSAYCPVIPAAADSPKAPSERQPSNI
jgi:hypothetical protein